MGIFVSVPEASKPTSVIEQEFSSKRSSKSVDVSDLKRVPPLDIHRIEEFDFSHCDEDPDAEEQNEEDAEEIKADR